MMNYNKYGKMRIKIHKNILPVIILFCSITFSSGQQPADSLLHYLGLAARNNPEVLSKYYEYQAALQKIPQAGGLPDPELSMGLFLSPMELLSGNQVADVRFMQMFPWFGVLKNAKDEMSLMAKAKYESFRDAKEQVFFDVRKTWYEMLKNNISTRIAEKNLEILKIIERLSISKFRASSVSGTEGSEISGSDEMSAGMDRINVSGASGMKGMSGNSGISQPSTSGMQKSSMPGSAMGSMQVVSGLADLYRIQIEIGEITNNIALLKSRHKTLTARFNSYLNRQAASPVALPDTILKDSLPVPLTVHADSLLMKNPMLEMLLYEKQSLEARKKMIIGMGYPMAGVGLNYSVISNSEMSVSEMNGKDMIMPMISVTLPVYRKKYRAMKAETELMQSATGYEYNNTANMLQAEYYEALQMYYDAGRRMNLYSEQSTLAEKSLNIMIKSYSAAGDELTDLLKINQQLLDYQLRLVEAIADYNTAIAWLNRLVAGYGNQEM